MLQPPSSNNSNQPAGTPLNGGSRRVVSEELTSALSLASSFATEAGAVAARFFDKYPKTSAMDSLMKLIETSNYSTPEPKWMDAAKDLATSISVLSAALGQQIEGKFGKADRAAIAGAISKVKELLDNDTLCKVVSNVASESCVDQHDDTVYDEPDFYLECDPDKVNAVLQNMRDAVRTGGLGALAEYMHANSIHSDYGASVHLFGHIIMKYGEDDPSSFLTRLKKELRGDYTDFPEDYVVREIGVACEMFDEIIEVGSSGHAKLMEFKEKLPELTDALNVIVRYAENLS